MWIGLIAIQLSIRCLLYRLLKQCMSPWLLLEGCAVHSILFSEAHFCLLWSHGPNVLPSIAKCLASLYWACPTTNQSFEGLGQSSIEFLQWNTVEALLTHNSNDLYSLVSHSFFMLPTWYANNNPYFCDTPYFIAPCGPKPIQIKPNFTDFSWKL